MPRAHTGRTCGEPNEINLTAAHWLFYRSLGSRWTFELDDIYGRLRRIEDLRLVDEEKEWTEENNTKAGNAFDVSTDVIALEDKKHASVIGLEVKFTAADFDMDPARSSTEVMAGLTASLRQALGPDKHTSLIKVLDLALPKNQVQTETILFDAAEADLVTRGVRRGHNEAILDQVAAAMAALEKITTQRKLPRPVWHVVGHAHYDKQDPRKMREMVALSLRRAQTCSAYLAKNGGCKHTVPSGMGAVETADFPKGAEHTHGNKRVEVTLANGAQIYRQHMINQTANLARRATAADPGSDAAGDHDAGEGLAVTVSGKIKGANPADDARSTVGVVTESHTLLVYAS